MTEFGEIRTAFEYISDLVPQNYTRDHKDTKASMSVSSSTSAKKVKDQPPSKLKQGQNKCTSVSSSKVTNVGSEKHTRSFTSVLAEDKQDKNRSMEIREQVENFLKALYQTELQFPSSFNSHDRLLVHQIAEELGLIHKSTGEGKNRYVTVSRILQPTPAEEPTPAEKPTAAEEKEVETSPQCEPLPQAAVDLKSLHLERMKREQQKREENAQQKKLLNTRPAPAQASKKAKGLEQKLDLLFNICCVHEVCVTFVFCLRKEPNEGRRLWHRCRRCTRQRLWHSDQCCDEGWQRVWFCHV